MKANIITKMTANNERIQESKNEHKQNTIINVLISTLNITSNNT